MPACLCVLCVEQIQQLKTLLTNAANKSAREKRTQPDQTQNSRSPRTISFRICVQTPGAGGVSGSTYWSRQTCGQEWEQGGGVGGVSDVKTCPGRQTPCDSNTPIDWSFGTPDRKRGAGHNPPPTRLENIRFNHKSSTTSAPRALHRAPTGRGRRGRGPAA